MSDVFQQAQQEIASSAPVTTPDVFKEAASDLSGGDVFSQAKAELPEPPKVDPGILDSIIGPTTALGTLGTQIRQDLGRVVNEVGQGHGFAAAKDLFTIPARVGASLSPTLPVRSPVTNTNPLMPQDKAFSKPTVDLSELVDDKEHPVLHAAATYLSQLESPESIGIIKLTGNLGIGMSKERVSLINKIVAAKFSLDQVASAFTHSKAALEAYKSGNEHDTLSQLTYAVMSLAGSVPGAAEVAGKPMPLMRPGGATDVVAGKVGQGIDTARTVAANAASAVAENREAALADRSSSKASAESAKLDAATALEKTHDLGVIDDGKYQAIKQQSPVKQAESLHNELHSDSIRENGPLTTATEDGKDFRARCTVLTPDELEDPAIAAVLSPKNPHVGATLLGRLTPDSGVVARQ